MLRKLQTEDNAPWKVRYKAAAIYASQIASLKPDKGILAHNRSGTLQWYAWDIPTNELQALTDTPGGHATFLILSPDGQWVYYLNDKQGNEIGHYVRMSSSGGEPQDITPDLPLYASLGFAVSGSGNRISFLAAYENAFKLYCMDIDRDGTPHNLREIHSSTEMLLGPLLSVDGAEISVMSSERTGKPQFSLLAFDGSTGEKIGELWEAEENSLELLVPSRLPGDPRLLATTNSSGIEAPLIWNPRTGQRTDLKPANLAGAVYASDWSADGSLILLTSISQAVQKLHIHNLSTGETIALHYPDGTCYGPYFTPRGDEVFAAWENSTQPTRLIALSSRTGEVLRTVISAGEVPSGHDWQSVSFPSSDGQTIQGWLGLPEGDGPFATVIETHGGPTTVQGNTFSPRAQAWLDHGFAYFTLNYRGSTTFGREFEQKIWGHPGQWEIEDLLAARSWLVGQKISRAEAILLTGWSYGGYLTLLGLGNAPDLWAGGMAGIAIADWVMSYEDSAETLRGYQKALFGGTPEEKPEQYRLSSPITYAEQVRAPVLIIQGRNDTRTPPRPIEAYEVKMKSLGKQIQVEWYDTGHGGSYTSVETGIRNQELMLRFAYRVLG